MVGSAHVFVFVLMTTLSRLLVGRLAVVSVYKARLLRRYALFARLFCLTWLPGGNKTSVIAFASPTRVLFLLTQIVQWV